MQNTDYRLRIRNDEKRRHSLFIAHCALCIVLFLLYSCSIHRSQTVENKDITPQDSLIVQNEFSDSTLTDSLSLQNEFSDSTFTDSLSLLNEISDSTQTDSLGLQNKISDTVAKEETMRLSPNAVETIVDYFAEDSVEFDIRNKKTLLYSNTNLLYEEIELQSYFVTIDFSKNELHAEGMLDSNNNLQEKPIFKQGVYEFKCHELDYNFTSKKGLIKNVITQEGEGYLHGELVKKNADNTNFIHRGKYTTCNLEHPHFEIDFGKAKVIPSERIITGPLYLRIANIPTFLALPFGFFPNSDKRTNGLLIGKSNSKAGVGTGGFVYSPTLGYYLSGIGYYFVAIKDRLDFAITADIYMQRAFGIEVASNYAKRYSSSGDVDIKYQRIPNGEPTTDSFSTSNDFVIRWKHYQDRKAHPTNNFSANVDFQTSGFSKNAPTMDYDRTTSSSSNSSISFSTSFKNRYSLGVNANMSLNLATNDLDLDLPQINFNVQPFYPMRKKKRAGKLRWYEEISMQYTVDMRNGLHTKDSILFHHFPEAMRLFNSEMNHIIPIKSTIKIFKYISWNNSLSMNELWRMKVVHQTWERGFDSVQIAGKDTIREVGIVNRDTAYGFFTAHNLAYNSDLSTTLYGMYIMKKGRVYAFRHSFTPSVGFRYQPGAFNKRLNESYYDSIGKREIPYSLISSAYKTSASVNFALNNKLEMKVRKKKENEDDEEEFKKVTLLESFSISTFYDFMRDSLRLDPIRINGRTLIFKYINLSFNFQFDPYSYDDTLGTRTNLTEWKATNHKRLLRFSSTAWDISCGLNLNKNFFKRKNKEKTTEVTVYGFKDWSMSISYSFRYNLDDNRFYYQNYNRYRQDTTILQYTHKFTNTLNIRGTLPITPKWSLSLQTGYDFTNKQVSYSDFTIERDLHCWTMKFTWRPIGYARCLIFNFVAKASILQGIPPEIKREITEY